MPLLHAGHLPGPHRCQQLRFEFADIVLNIGFRFEVAFAGEICRTHHTRGFGDWGGHVGPTRLNRLGSVTGLNSSAVRRWGNVTPR